MGSTPDTPNYNSNLDRAEQNRINQLASAQQYANVNSPLGGYSVTVDPTTGQLTVNKTLSDASQMALDRQKYALSNYTADPTQAANAYYNAQMAYLQPHLDRQVARAESSMTNRGLPLGSKAWNEYLGDVYENQNRTLSALSNEALANGQQYQANILNQAGLLGSQVIDPTMISGQAGAGLENTYDKQFSNEIEAWKQKQANKNALTSGILGAVGTIGGAALGSLLMPGAGTAAGAALGSKVAGGAD